MKKYGSECYRERKKYGSECYREKKKKMDQNVTERKNMDQNDIEEKNMDQNGVLTSALMYILSILSFNPGMIIPFRRLQKIWR